MDQRPNTDRGAEDGMGQADEVVDVREICSMSQAFTMQKQKLKYDDWWKMQREINELRKQNEHLAGLAVAHELALDRAREFFKELDRRVKTLEVENE